MNQVRTNFIPEQHGFKFRNSFDFPDLFQFKLPFIRAVPISIDELVYGLCGGMCFASLDYFHAGKSVPDFTNPDDINLKLFFHLWERQLASFSSGVVRRVFKWMLIDDTILARTVNQWEIPKLRNKIDNSEPAVLALIRVKGISDPTNNHQVLACGYDHDPVTKDMTVYLYDPNHPSKQPTLSMNLSSPGKGIALTQSTKEPLRGFFLIDYERQTPP